MVGHTMMTTRGEMDAAFLRQEVLHEPCPCGESITTTYYALDNGELVRQDVVICVITPPALSSDTGSIGE